MRRSRFRISSLAIFGALMAAACAVAGAQSAPPANDDFAGAVMASIEPPGSAFEHRVSTERATREDGEPGCVAGGTVWYLFHASVSGEYTVDVSGSDFPASLGVFRITDFAPSPPGGSLSEVACTSAPSLTFTGHSSDGLYAIQTGGAPGAAGNLHLRVACEPACPAYNDGIGSVLLLEVPFTDSISTEAATLEPGEPRPCGDIGRTVWYRIDTFERAGDRIQVDAIGDGFQAVAAVYELDVAAGPSPPGALGFIGCDDGAAGTDSANIAFTTEPFTQYHVQIGGAGESGGVLAVSMSCQELLCQFQAVPGIETGAGEPQRGGDATGGGGLAPPNTGSAGLR